MTRKFFDWHPELNLFAKNIRGKVQIMLNDGDGNHIPPPEKMVGFIDSNDVAEYYFNSDKQPDVSNVCVKSPWPVTWVEYIMPEFEDPTEMELLVRQLLPGDLYFGAYVLLHDVDEEDSKDVLAGDLGLNLVALADQTIPEDFSIPLWKQMSAANGRDWTMRALSQKKQCRTIQVFQIYMADRKRWEIVGYMIFYLDEYGIPLEGATAELVGPSDASIASYIVKPFLMTLGLLNCKNVETKCLPTSNIQAKKLRKHGSPVITRKTLIVHPKGKRYETNATGTGGKRSWHMCRGHFKTFTDEAPLFGRVTGTFWWGSQVRGSKSVGEVHKDYKIEPE